MNNDMPTVVVPSDPKTRRNDFRLGVAADSRHERKRQRNSPRCAGKIKSCYRKKPAEKVGFFYFSITRRKARAHLYTVPVCAQNPEGALRSISDTAPLRGFCRSHSVTEPPQRLGFPASQSARVDSEASTPMSTLFLQKAVEGLRGNF